MRRIFLMLLLLSADVFAGRAGLVVQFDSSNVVKKCVEFQGGGTAYDVLKNSNLEVVTYGDPLWGVGLCKIDDVGCPAENCFCGDPFNPGNCNPIWNSNICKYWGFYYERNGEWVYSEVGVSGYGMRDGDVIGFRWGGYGDLPAFYSFDEICPSQAGEVQPMKNFSIEVEGNCAGEPVMIEVKEGGGGVIWEPTNFILSSRNGLNITLEHGVGVDVLLHQVYFGRDAGFEKVALLFTDKSGKANFTPKKSGVYLLKFEKDGFVSEEREVQVVECERAVRESSRYVEAVGVNQEVEPNITRVEIAAPQTSLLNSTVLIRMLSEEGKPLAYETIIVRFEGGEKQLITNESGEATFTPEEEGIYSYYSPTHLLHSYVVTNVIKEANASLEVPEKAEQPPSVGMATAAPSPALVAGGVIIILIFLYLIKEVRK